MDRSCLIDLHASAEAALAPAADGAPGVLLTYGDVPAEYQAAQEGCAVLDETARGLVAVSGPDAAAFLHRLLANTVRTLQPGQGLRNLLLSSKGKVLFDFDLAFAAERIELSTEPGEDGRLAQALEMYHFSEEVELAAEGARHAPLALVGPKAAEVLRAVLGAEPPEGDHAWVEGRFEDAPARVASLPIAGSPGLRVDAGPERAAALWKALRAGGAIPAGLVVRDILRVEAGWAQPGVDIDENVYPQEARLERAFSLEKGCYIGQEVVAKIDTYGGLNKRLMGLRVEHDDPVPRGTRLFQDEDGELRDLGLVTSWAYSFALDTGMVLAYVKRRHQDPGTRFQLGDSGATAEIVALPVRANALPAPTSAG